MKFGSLFSGIGGFDLGFEQSGLSSVWQVEIDNDCNRVLSRQWPNVERFKDVSTIGKLGSVDVICGGFPCQDLSVAGKRAGLAGERSGLWFEFLRIVGLNRPRWIVIENVPGLLSSDEGRDFALILRGLVECGYLLAWRNVDAQFYRVAQRRRRVFIVGSLGDGSCAEILFESESVSWNPPTRREAGERVAPTVRGGTASGSNESGNKIGVLPVNRGAEFRKGDSGGVSGGAGSTGDHETARTGRGCLSDVAATLDQRGRGPTDAVMMNLQISGAVSSKWAKGTGGPAGDEAYNLVTHALRSEGADASEDGTGRGTPLVCATLNSGGNNGGFRSEPGEHLTVAFTERTRSEGRTFEAQEELAYAITNPGSGGRTHSRQIAGQFGVRRLTPRECERLQGFPDDWTLYDANGKEISDSARYRMLGNAVAVPVARWIGERILKITGVTGVNQ